MKIFRLLFTSAAAAIVLVVFTACSPPADPRATPIAAATPEDFNAWKSAAAQKIPRAEMDEFDACVNEIRLGITQRKEATGVGPVAQKLCEYIDGKTMREVLHLGYTTTVDWVTKELVIQRTNMQKSAEALDGPGSDSAKAGIRDYYNQVKDNVTKLEARLAKAKTRLAELQAEKTK